MKSDEDGSVIRIELSKGGAWIRKQVPIAKTLIRAMFKRKDHGALNKVFWVVEYAIEDRTRRGSLSPMIKAHYAEVKIISNVMNDN